MRSRFGRSGLSTWGVDVDGKGEPGPMTLLFELSMDYLGTILEPLPVLRDGFQMQSEVNAHIHFRCTLKIKYPLLYCSCVNNSIFY